MGHIALVGIGAALLFSKGTRTCEMSPVKYRVRQLFSAPGCVFAKKVKVLFCLSVYYSIDEKKSHL